MSAEPAVATILVVEDDRSVRDLLETVLEAEGYEVVTAVDGLEALLKVKVVAPAAVVLDLMMPDVGGLRVLDELAAEHAEVPVLVVTGNPDGADTAREILGADRVLTKPFDVGVVLDIVRAMTDEA